MLQQTTEETSTPSATLSLSLPSAPEVRVTPQELSLAVASLEMRREAEQQRREETLPLGEAIHQLGLTVTPEELLAEVNTVRSRQQEEARRAAQRQRFRRAWTVLGIGTLLTVFVVMGTTILTLRHSLNKALHPYPMLPIRTLAQTPENHVVHCDLDTLTKLSDGSLDPNQAMVDTREESAANGNTGAFNNEWAVTKSDGMVYVTAWTTADRALIINNGKAAAVYSNRPAWLPEANLVTLQIPINRFSYRANNGQRSSQYDSKGVAANSGVTECYVLDDASMALQHDIIQFLTRRNSLLSKEHEVDSSSDNFYDANYSVDVKDNTVKLTGSVASEALKQKAEALANEALHDVRLSYHVDNRLTIEKPDTGG